MMNNYLFQVYDLRFQLDDVIPKKIPIFEEYRAATNIARLFMIINRHRGIKMASNGNKITVVTVI